MTRAIPVAGLARLSALRRRTAAVAVLFGVALLTLVLAAVLATRHASQPSATLVPQSTNAIVVLDLSASISSDTFQLIGSTLRALAATHGRVGLVGFSDVAYLALPPGTPAEELKPYARYFALPPATNSGFLPQFPVNPWTNSFSAGTRISAGLGLALQTIRDRGLRRPAVILVSDLDDDSGDLQSLTSVALAYRHLHIPVRIVALNAQPRDAQFFAEALSGDTKITTASPRGGTARAGGESVSRTLALLAVAIAVALASMEIWSARLTWGEA